MSPVVRNGVALVAALVAGSAVNMGLIAVSASAIPPPAGADVTTAAGLKASMHLFEPRHFVFPFLAHALGTLVGALVAARLAASRKRALAVSVGAVFLAGGIASAWMLPAPLWFIALDLVGAYLPMAWLGWKVAAGGTRPIAVQA